MLRGEIVLDDIDRDSADFVRLQDHVAQIGQGTIPDFSAERLGQGDKGVVMIRHLWARELKALAEKRGLTIHCIAANNLQPNRLDFLNVDCYVSTACPRLALDDSHRFAKPILTPIEFEILLGERTWNDYEYDQIH